MLSLRNAVIALVASAALVLVLSGVSAGVFNGVFTTTPEPPRELPPIAAHPDVAAPVPALGPDVQPGPVPLDVPVPRSLPVHQEPVAHPAVYRRVVVQRQPIPVAHQPVPVTPAQNPLPVSPPPAPALPVSSRSRTVNTEPCSCDGVMRRVPTHWDPPQD